MSDIESSLNGALDNLNGEKVSFHISPFQSINNDCIPNNVDLFGAVFTSSSSILILNSQFEEGAREGDNGWYGMIILGVVLEVSQKRFQEKLNKQVKETTTKIRLVFKKAQSGEQILASINFNFLSLIKKDRDKVEKKLASATKDYTNAVNKSRVKFSKKSNRQNDIDEKKAVMDLWKSKLNAAVSE